MNFEYFVELVNRLDDYQERLAGGRVRDNSSYTDTAVEFFKDENVLRILNHIGFKVQSEHRPHFLTSSLHPSCPMILAIMNTRSLDSDLDGLNLTFKPDVIEVSISHRVKGDGFTYKFLYIKYSDI